MYNIDIDARAKINLTLDVLSKRPDGYHEVEMIMQSIDLKDHLEIELVPKKKIEISTDCKDLPTDDQNLVYKAAALMINKFDLDAGIRIKLNKEIPLAAGLAGGSADAAAMIIGINELFDLKKSEKELMAIGKSIGADVPFCIHGGTALARGIGEKITALRSAPEFELLLVKPPCFVSTKEVYNKLDIKNINNRPDNRKVVKAIENQDVLNISKGLCNVLEDVTFSMHPELLKIKAWLLENGALGSLMSGSGPTVFGIFESKSDVNRALEKMPFDKCNFFISGVK